VALAEWRPPDLTATECIGAQRPLSFAALLDQEAGPTAHGDPLPPLWHWLYFLDWPRQSDLGPDGHPLSGGFLPPIPNRRRMFAGGRVTFRCPLRYGDVVTRRSRLLRCETKEGRSGTLHFVTVEHRLDRDGRELLVEEQDLVYRSAVEPAAPPALQAGDAGFPERDSPWQLRFRLDPVALFRFSALTGNAHRIHYDLPYARDVEGFPGLVVHGPLLALLLMEAVRRCGPPRAVASFRFRAARPVFAGDPILVHGAAAGTAGAHLLVEGGGSPSRMTADVEFGAPAGDVGEGQAESESFLARIDDEA